MTIDGGNPGGGKLLRVRSSMVEQIIRDGKVLEEAERDPTFPIEPSVKFYTDRIASFMVALEEYDEARKKSRR